MLEIRIPEKSAAGFRVEEGQSFRVIDSKGGQVADLVAFDPENPDERFSTKYTYRRDGKLRISTGDSLYTTEGEEILEIVADDCGTHDLLYGPCNHWILEDYYDQQDETGCRENLAAALEARGIDESLIHSPMNVFMKTEVTDQTHVSLREPDSEPGDAVEFRAKRDAVVGVSACAAESVVNAGATKPIDLEVPDGTDVDTTF